MSFPSLKPILLLKYMETYKGVTVAGYHSLHRQVWNKIAEEIKADNYIGKEEAFGLLNLFPVAHDCFACEINRQKKSGERFKGELPGCIHCPITEWVSYNAANCCKNGRGSLTPDDFISKVEVANALATFDKEVVIEYAEYVRDLEWKESNEVIY